jgi:Raffinose synthase or seed imbibition protein Sip1
LFKVESKDFIPRNSVDDAKFETKVFGSSPAGFCRYMTLVRIWAPWLAPRHGERRFRLTEDALLCSFLTNDGQHAVLLPMNGVNDVVTVFRSDEEGHILLAARNDGGAETKFEFLAAIADDFGAANAAVMYEARNIILRNRSVDEQASLDSAHIETKSADTSTIPVSKYDRPGGPQPESRPQWLEEWYDGLTYCTWNSLGQDLTAEKLFVALDDLATNNIHVSGLIIDDNWQSLDGIQGTTSQFQRGWTNFDANNKGFPDGLKSTVTRVKTQHPAIRDVAVWHGLHGYWGGISPSGNIAMNYKTSEVEKQPGTAGGKMLAVDPSDIHRMYDDFYAFLSSCGITSVKTDVQFYLDMLASTPNRRAFTTAYQAAWTTAHLRHFAGKAISCMSQIPQILFHSFLPVNTPRILLRNTDDFFPSVPASHPWHVFCNAHNALFVQHLNVLPDWDMFQTTHPYSGFHAAARCVSGGPIYITDTPGEHDLDLIAQMTAENVRGQTVILRPSVVGKTIDIYDQYHEGHLLKVGTYHGAAQTGNGILGLFNISDHEISAMVPINDFPGVDALPPTIGDEKHESAVSGKFIIRSHVTKKISNPITPSTPIPPANLSLITLPVRGYDILTAHPVYDFSMPALQQTPASSTSIAILGLLGKMTGASAITSLDFKNVDASKLRTYVSLKALGTLGVWISDLGLRSIDDGFLIIIREQMVPRARVKKRVLDSGDSSDAQPRYRPGVLEIDVLGAWKDMKLDSGWSNEVTVEIHMLGHDRHEKD